MPSTPAKTLSPAELAKLEHAFATEPGSDAYRPLAEAYLAMARFMEAMVVCKKGVKAHPTSPEPRVLLARVYAEQGKDKKALEELAGALQVAPNDKGVLRYTGAVQMKAGAADGAGPGGCRGPGAAGGPGHPRRPDRRPPRRLAAAPPRAGAGPLDRH